MPSKVQKLVDMEGKLECTARRHRDSVAYVRSTEESHDVIVFKCQRSRDFKSSRNDDPGLSRTGPDLCSQRTRNLAVLFPPVKQGNRFLAIEKSWGSRRIAKFELT
jgi:hypothetical protein